MIKTNLQALPPSTQFKWDPADKHYCVRLVYTPSTELGRYKATPNFVDLSTGLSDWSGKKVYIDVPSFADLKALRLLIGKVPQDLFTACLMAASKCDDTYALKHWVEFSDAPLLWLTSHSYGEDVYRLLLTAEFP